MFGLSKVDEILIVKEGLGHKQYESIRKNNDNLLDAAMRDNAGDAQIALSGKANPNSPRDMYDLTPLYYASHHKNAEIVKMFVSNTSQPANVFVQDEEGLLPIHRAILLGHVDVVSSLLDAMESSPTCTIRRPLHGDLAAAALEKPAWGESLPTDLIQRIVKFESAHLRGAKLLHAGPQETVLRSFVAASRMGLADLMASIHERDGNGCTPLDCALRFILFFYFNMKHFYFWH